MPMAENSFFFILLHSNRLRAGRFKLAQGDLVTDSTRDRIFSYKIIS